MQKKTISDLIASFDEQSDKAKNCLTDLLDIVKDGRVPSPEAMSSLDGYITELHTRYDALDPQLGVKTEIIIKVL